MPKSKPPAPDALVDIAAMSVEQLRVQLHTIEAKYDVLRGIGVRGGPQWEAVGVEAGKYRQRLFELTGDLYGRPKVKLEKPSDDLLSAQYSSPGAVPPIVMNWLLRHNQILTSDATDAVRWARIVDTQGDERYGRGLLTIYRAVDGDEIRPGDWVTTDHQYARQHLERYLGASGKIVEMDVDGVDVLVSPTGNHEEAIYAPLQYSGEYCYESEEAQESSAPHNCRP